MLLQLDIRNYVIIEQISFRPDAKLNILTGETGAGKSIILGALGLILGERADATTLLNKEKKCIIEAVFEVKHHDDFIQLLQEENLDIEEDCVVRREINPNGKSRAFVNDTPVTLSMLQKLMFTLVDLHQQFGHLALKEDYFQMNVLDAVANNQHSFKKYQEVYRDYTSICLQINHLKKQQAQYQQEADYKNFLLQELEEAAFLEHEIETLEQDLKKATHAEGILSSLQYARFALNENEQAVIQEIKKLMQELEGLQDMMEELKPQYERLNTCYEELKDIAAELESLESKVDIDPQQMQLMQERLDMGFRLLKKHNLQQTHELLELQQQLTEEMKGKQSSSEKLEAMEKEAAQRLSTLQEIGKSLSAKRKKAIPDFEKKLNHLLGLVGMPNARFQVQLATLQEPLLHGYDTVQFLLDANKSGVLSPIYKAASGGEMSRIMLCVKSLVAKALDMPTLVFDEVDTGISGEAARQVGVLLKNLAQHHQIICITHQPQVAAKADSHYYVYKQATKVGNMVANLRLLDEEEHVFAIAQMIGGEKPSEVALKNAKELAQPD